MSIQRKEQFSQPSPPLRMTRQVYDAIRRTVGARAAETGGMLGGDREKGLITHFQFDKSGRRSGVTYSPDHARLNKLLKKEWGPADVKLMGFVHSHPPGCRAPSGGDHFYAGNILGANEAIEALFLPIVMSKADAGRFEMLPFVARRASAMNGVQVSRTALDLVEDHEDGGGTQDPAGRFDVTESFSRVQDAYDLQKMTRSRIIAVGVGGAVSFLEEMARAGVEEFILIDADTIAETNIATQQVYRSDVGRAKVICLAERLYDINPNVRVLPLRCRIEDVSDVSFEELVWSPLESAGSPARTLLCGFTDSFHAQARVNRLALHFGLPSLCAQLYRMGRGLELTFTSPGLTPACHRCILSARYKKFLEEGFQNDVGSQGTPIFATTRLNALKGFVALALLHHETEMPADAHPAAQRWSRLLDRIGPRNLAWVRTDPDLELPAFAQVLGGAEQRCLLFDETIWRPQTPDGALSNRPVCPDCGGTGDLRDSIGSFQDTRIMRLKAEEGTI